MEVLEVLAVEAIGPSGGVDVDGHLDGPTMRRERILAEETKREEGGFFFPFFFEDLPIGDTFDDGGAVEVFGSSSRTFWLTWSARSTVEQMEEAGVGKRVASRRVEWSFGEFDGRQCEASFRQRRPVELGRGGMMGWRIWTEGEGNGEVEDATVGDGEGGEGGEEEHEGVMGPPCFRCTWPAILAELKDGILHDGVGRGMGEER